MAKIKRFGVAVWSMSTNEEKIASLYSDGRIEGFTYGHQDRESRSKARARSAVRGHCRASRSCWFYFVRLGSASMLVVVVVVQQ